MSEERCKHCGRALSGDEIYEQCNCQNKRVTDYTCSIHGKKMSEHPPYGCLYCCLCFRDLTPDTCHVLPDGTKEDVCNQCAEEEVKHE